jgi:hypothetical protein
MRRLTLLAALCALAAIPAPASAAPQCSVPRPIRLLANHEYVTVDPQTFVLSASSSRAGQWELFRICPDPATGLVALQLDYNQRFVTPDLAATGTAWATLRAIAPSVAGAREGFVVARSPFGLGYTLRNAATGRYVTGSVGPPGYRAALTASSPTGRTAWETFSW